MPKVQLLLSLLDHYGITLDTSYHSEIYTKFNWLETAQGCQLQLNYQQQLEIPTKRLEIFRAQIAAALSKQQLHFKVRTYPIHDSKLLFLEISASPEQWQLLQNKSKANYNKKPFKENEYGFNNQCLYKENPDIKLIAQILWEEVYLSMVTLDKRYLTLLNKALALIEQAGDRCSIIKISIQFPMTATNLKEFTNDLAALSKLLQKVPQLCQLDMPLLYNDWQYPEFARSLADSSVFFLCDPYKISKGQLYSSQHASLYNQHIHTELDNNWQKYCNNDGFYTHLNLFTQLPLRCLELVSDYLSLSASDLRFFSDSKPLTTSSPATPMKSKGKIILAELRPINSLLGFFSSISKKCTKEDLEAARKIIKVLTDHTILINNSDLLGKKHRYEEIFDLLNTEISRVQLQSPDYGDALEATRKLYAAKMQRELEPLSTLNPSTEICNINSTC